MDESKNNYFTLATFTADEAGQFYRKKENFAALHSFVLDDVGTKVDSDRVALPPSWLLETSPGNYQAGYLLAEPLTDKAMAEKMMNAIIDAGLCDAGASGPLARLMRLPCGINGKQKYQPPFQCRLAEWNPDKRYAIAELVAGLGLELSDGKKKRQKDSTATTDDTAVYIPRPDENPVIAALQARSLYKSMLARRKHDITCPWVAEHTDAVDSGACYWEPDDDHPHGGFKCQHSHGERLHIGNLLSFLEIDPTAARMKALIRLKPGQLHRLADAAERVLALSGLGIYQSAGIIVQIVTDPATTETVISPVSVATLTRVLSRAAYWERYDGRSSLWVTADPSPKLVSILHDESCYQHLPVLRGIVRQPFLREDGSLVSTPGYDTKSGMFGVFDQRRYNIPDRPDKKAALEALEVLCSAIEESAFATEADKAATLCALLTAVVRASLPTAPAFLVAAHVIASGKSYLTRLIGAMATAHSVPGTAFPRDADEMRKSLIAFLIKAPAVINFDDMSNDITPSEALKTALTEQHISGRLLGVSKDVNCSTRTMFLFSGNNVQPVADMARRVLTIHLDPHCETPAAKVYKNPHREEQVRSKRHIYIAAALTIIRAWLVAGGPKTTAKPVASYGQWSDWCRQPLLWLGQPDPAQRLFEQLAHDPGTELLGRILQGWHTAYGGQSLLVRDVIAFGGDADFREALLEAAGERGEINARLLGWWLKRHNGRIIGGLRLDRGDVSRGAARWKVQVLQDLQVPTSDNARTVRKDTEVF